MRSGGGKAKGSAFERWVAKELSLWLTRGADAKQLIRSVLSGGWTAHRKTSDEPWRHAGDLAPNGPIGEAFRKAVAVECKHYGVIDLYGYWQPTHKLNVWWEKLNEEASEAGCASMLVFRANLRPTMVMLDAALWTAWGPRGAVKQDVYDARQASVFLTRLDAVLVPLDAMKVALTPPWRP